MRERTSFTIPDAPGRDCLIDDAAESAIEHELGHSPERSKSSYRTWLVMMTMQGPRKRSKSDSKMRRLND